MSLPANVISTDQQLSKATDELARLRWHWTLNEANPGRVGFSEYARQVGRDESTIRTMARGYATWLADVRTDRTNAPGQPQTIADHVELAKIGAERQEAVKAIARETGVPVSKIASTRSTRREVDAVVNTARERAVDRGTTVEHEIERAAEWREKARIYLLHIRRAQEEVEMLEGPA